MALWNLQFYYLPLCYVGTIAMPYTCHVCVLNVIFSFSFKDFTVSGICIQKLFKYHKKSQPVTHTIDSWFITDTHPYTNMCVCLLI